MTEPIGERPDMAAYGTNTPDWQALPWKWAGDRLVANHNYWLVTVSAAAAPHAQPVWGVWHDDDQRFMFSCAAASRKARNLATNPRVVVTVDDTVECVSVEGKAVALSDDSRIDTWVDRYVEKYAHKAPEGLGEFLRQNPMFEVEPITAFAVIERVPEFATRATRWRFPQA